MVRLCREQEAERVEVVGEVVYALPTHVEGAGVGEVRTGLLGAVRGTPSKVVVVVDCSAVQRLSPGGLAVLVAASRIARGRGGRLRLERLSPPVDDALRAAGLIHLRP